MTGKEDVMTRSTGTPVAALRGASKRYGRLQALDGVDLEVRRGELLALLGPNGAGKSTAIGLLLGLLRPDAGRAELFGGNPQDIAMRRHVGVMLQSASLPPTLRVAELLRLVRSYYPDPRGLAESAARAGVTDLLERPWRKLSGGQQRRVQFALALCGNPRLLFLDEPSAGMDVEARQGLWKAIRELMAEGCSVVLTTHYLEEAEALAQRVVVLGSGRVLSAGSVAQLRSRVATATIMCRSTLDAAVVARWPHVETAMRDGERLHVTTTSAEAVLRRLLAADTALAGLEVRRASLAEAFTALTGASSGDASREAA